MHYFIRYSLVLAGLVFLSGCQTFTGIGKDNTPLPSALTSYKTQFVPQKNWAIQVGGSVQKSYLNLTPVIANNTIFVSNPQGKITAIATNNGKILWQTTLATSLGISASVDNGIVVVGGKNGVLYALAENNGKILWQTPLSDPAIAPAVITSNHVIAKTLDGEIWTLNSADGMPLWRYAHGTPLMVLAGGSQPIVLNNYIIAGYPDGKLTAYTLNNGRLLWETQIAQPQGASSVEQMVDIVANPIMDHDVVYVVTYQGNLAAVSPTNGRIFWQLPLSSYTGMALTPTTIFVTDAKSGVWAINRQFGKVLWHQTYLAYRGLTAPVIMNNAILMADGEGYLHWLSQTDGTTIARLAVSRSPIVSAPVIMGNNIFVLDTKGKLTKVLL